MSNRERRDAERIQFESRIVIKTEGDTVEATADSRNISLKGIYLIPEKKIPLGTHCTLDITLTGTASMMTLTIPGNVCRHDSKGMAVAFIDMDVDSFVHIKNLIKLHNPEADLTRPTTVPCPQSQ